MTTVAPPRQKLTPQPSRPTPEGAAILAGTASDPPPAATQARPVRVYPPPPPPHPHAFLSVASAKTETHHSDKPPKHQREWGCL
ncbi:hypothetical protein BaRGS_00021392 [Batillaria attramentaria]|uniref:Uncharacterized protein n=1 Tax=Batillaria attramentaria TaxID=370345 RepID=A0ABD0KJK8_9CAEN